VAKNIATPVYGRRICAELLSAFLEVAISFSMSRCLDLTAVMLPVSAKTQDMPKAFVHRHTWSGASVT
jgi:hypothetical protein